jgi:hypothetical protein
MAVSTDIFLELGTNFPSPRDIKYFFLQELIKELFIATRNVFHVAVCASCKRIKSVCIWCRSLVIVFNVFLEVTIFFSSSLCLETKPH